MRKIVLMALLLATLPAQAADVVRKAGGDGIDLLSG